MEKIIELNCIDDDFEGKGIVNYNKEEKHIQSLLKGEKASFSIKQNGKYTNLELKNILNKSEHRIDSLCKVCNECGGCQFQHTTYEHEIEVKQKYIESLFQTSRDVLIKPIIKMINPYNYRNKCQMTYKLSKTKKVVCGFYEEGSHRVIPVTDCKIQVLAAEKIINEVNRILTKNKIMPYDEYTRGGVLRHVLVRYGFNTKEVMLVFVTNGEFFPGRHNVTTDIIKANLGITTIVQNYNDRDTSVVMGDKERVLFGKGYIMDTIGDLKFKISPRSFYQINPLGMNLLYKEVLASLNVGKNDTILDTYCGVGTIGMCMAKYAKKVIGVELNKDAYKDAVLNAKLNNINNITFFNEDSTRFVKELANDNVKIDLLVLDPPRDGSTKDFINSVGILKPKKIIYVSCDPKTMVRDLYDFTKNDYLIKSVQGVDMFPRTSNLECVTVLELRK